MDRRQTRPGELVHGARSEVLKSADVSRIERNWRERLGVRLRDMPLFAREALREAARMERLLKRYDEVLDRVGPLRPSVDGKDLEPRGFLLQYQASSNSKRSALRDLAVALGQSQQHDSREQTLRELSQYRQSS